MAEVPSQPDLHSNTDDDIRPIPARSTPPSTPRWVYLLGAIALGLALLFVILHLTGNSLGGPGSHMPFMHHGGQQP